MRIEELTPDNIGNLSLVDISLLRQRCCQLWNEYFKGTVAKSARGLTREGLALRYIMLRRELQARGVRIRRATPLDEAVEPAIVAKAAWGLDLRSAGDIVLREAAVYFSGPWLEDPRGAPEIGVVIRKAEADRDEAAEAALVALLEKGSGKPCRVTYDPAAPEGEYMPAFDLVLRPRERMAKAGGRARAVEKKLTAAEQADYDRETALIAENGKKAEAQRAHKFRPAKWTHKNGHPRCLLCGDEEPLGGVCGKGAPVKKGPESTAAFDIAKPFPNEHACRKRDPGDFQAGSFRRMERDHEGKKYSVIMGRLNGETALTEQTARYPKDTWTPAAARAHCETHGGSFEAAAGTGPVTKDGGEDKNVLFVFRKVDTERHLVGGVVYEPDVVDTQGDFTTADEIDAAMEKFMERYFADPGRIKVQHEGKAYKFPVIECFQAEISTTKGGKPLAKGAWWLTVKITSGTIWKEVKDGRLTGWSMGGQASAPPAAAPA